MIGTLPPRPTGSSAEAKFMQWVWDNMISPLKINDSATIRVSRTTKGIFLEVKQDALSTTGSATIVPRWG